MKTLYINLFLLLSLFLSAPAIAENFSALKKTDTAKVIEIITPQTLILSNGQIINLTGLHFADYTPQDTGPFAQTALKVLKDLLTGKNVVIYQSKNKNKGRQNRMDHQLAHLYMPEKKLWVQGALLSLGLAQVKTSAHNPEMAAQMLEIETAARAKKAGIWEFTKILPNAESASVIGSFAIIEGHIKSASMKKNRTYLNFGQNWREDFTITIAPENRKIFSKQSINPLDWNNKKVRIRGFVKDYNGPYIELTHPEQIEILE